MACMTVPWAPVAALINSLPLSAAGMRDHGSSGTGGPRTSRTAAAPARGL
jgi:hypothetical protein